jgi:hypothetical protein
MYKLLAKHVIIQEKFKAVLVYSLVPATIAKRSTKGRKEDHIDTATRSIIIHVGNTHMYVVYVGTHMYCLLAQVYMLATLSIKEGISNSI